MSRSTKPPLIVPDSQPGLPEPQPGLRYSKGLMASRVLVTGLSGARAYDVAERIEDALLSSGVATVTNAELNELAVRELTEMAGERYAKNYRRWLEVERLDTPLVILIGGATGVGKSTIATQLAARLGIVRVVATDAIREVMRSMLSSELMPTLYTSSFDAGTALREPTLRGSARVIAGFREQTEAVVVGLAALLERAAFEGTKVIIEGAHVVPGYFDLERWGSRFLAVPMVITVDDEDAHRSHFAARSADLPTRPVDRYRKGFDNIRRLQKFIRSQALAHGVPIIPNYDLDQAMAAVIDLVVERATDFTEERPAAQVVGIRETSGMTSGGGRT
jgi:2-phosphoglycerate kinase